MAHMTVDGAAGFQLTYLGQYILYYSHPKGCEIGIYLTAVLPCIFLKPKQLPYD